MEKAIVWLKENGIAKAAKKSGRIAADGVINIVKSGKQALICEINSETDFVARNEKFLKLVDEISEALLTNDVVDPKEAIKLKLKDSSIEESLIQMTSIIGEKISLRRFEK